MDLLRLFEKKKQLRVTLMSLNQMNTNSLIEPYGSPTSANPDLQLEPSSSVEPTSELSDTGNPALPSSTGIPTNEESPPTTSSEVVNPLQDATDYCPA